MRDAWNFTSGRRPDTRERVTADSPISAIYRRLKCVYVTPAPSWTTRTSAVKQDLDSTVAVRPQLSHDSAVRFHLPLPPPHTPNTPPPKTTLPGHADRATRRRMARARALVSVNDELPVNGMHMNRQNCSSSSSSSSTAVRETAAETGSMWHRTRPSANEQQCNLTRQNDNGCGPAQVPDACRALIFAMPQNVVV